MMGSTVFGWSVQFGLILCFVQKKRFLIGLADQPFQLRTVEEACYCEALRTSIKTSCV